MKKIIFLMVKGAKWRFVFVFFLLIILTCVRTSAGVLGGKIMDDLTYQGCILAHMLVTLDLQGFDESINQLILCGLPIKNSESLFELVEYQEKLWFDPVLPDIALVILIERSKSATTLMLAQAIKIIWDFIQEYINKKRIKTSLLHSNSSANPQSLFGQVCFSPPVLVLVTSK